MPSPEEILLQYWGYSRFRPLQREIIQSVLEGHDTLALLPTGGGKSVCFQVPALCIGKLCLVVSPLIALMSDQVENLRKRGIAAGMLSSAMSPQDLPVVLSNAMAGHYQFLYVSPERLVNEHFRNAMMEMDIGLVAVDESHCISQWGYDFRPAYLNIAEIRPLLPSNTPLIALTATATPEVCDDIRQKLQFRKGQTFSKSFARKELSYVVRETEDKLRTLLRILDKIQGSAVVYVRNRKKTREVALWLEQQGVSATSYHAGLDAPTRSLRQQLWIENQKRVIVSTNAFGMGIDKPDVRVVVHLDIPDNPEAYFQEAGRAGRDEQKAWAVLLYDEGDLQDTEKRFQQQFPGIDTIKAVYNWVGNFLQVPVNAGEGISYPFDVAAFAKRYNQSPITCLQAIRFLEQEGLLTYSADQSMQSRAFIPIDKEKLYEYEMLHPSMELLVKTLLRSYGGMFQDYVVIRETELAERCQLSYDQVCQKLERLNKDGVVNYRPALKVPLMHFLAPRQHPDLLSISVKRYDERKNAARERLEAMLAYARNRNICRTLMLLRYFGEQKAKACGHCDICVSARQSEPLGFIEQYLRKKPSTLDEVMAAFRGPRPQFELAIRELADQGLIEERAEQLWHWKGE
jgi:ATP-dependent DNA helicase RecQ